MSAPSFSLGEKLATLARSKGYTQSEIAQFCDISRVSINRFFTGKTALKAKELTKLLWLLGIDLETQLDNLLNNRMPLERRPIEMPVSQVG